MRKCVYCNSELPPRQRKYCNSTCQAFFKERGPMLEPVVKRYEEVSNPQLELTKEGAWMLIRSSQTNQEAIGDFMRVWKRPPEHVIYDPAMPFWKFVGPIWTDEELTHRWRG